MSVLRFALENVDERQSDSPDDEEDGGLEATLMDNVAGIQEAEQVVGEQIATMECIDSLKEEIRYAIESNQATPFTLAIFKSRIAAFKGGSDVALESMVADAPADILDAHQMALEDLADVGHAMAHNFVLNWKHNISFFADLFKNTSVRAEKYRSKLAETRSLYEAKKNDLSRDPRQISLNNLWYFFATDKGQVKSIIDALGRDAEVSTYILSTYSGEILKEAKKFQTAFNMSTPATKKVDIEKAIKKLEGFTHPVDLFKKSYLGGKPYLDVMGLYVKDGGRSSSPRFFGDRNEKLGELIRTAVVKEDWSLKHQLYKVGANTTLPGVYANAILSKIIPFTHVDIPVIIGHAEKYIDNVQKYIDTGEDIAEVLSKTVNRYTSVKFSNKVASEDESSGKEAAELMRCIYRYLSALSAATTSPGSQEAARSIKGAKYCMFVAKRFIWALQ